LLPWDAENIDVLSSDGGDCGSKNANEATVAPVVGSGGVCVWLESGFSRCQDVFTKIYFVKILYFQ
jgi:hypothetical protein